MNIPLAIQLIEGNARMLLSFWKQVEGKVSIGEKQEMLGFWAALQRFGVSEVNQELWEEIDSLVKNTKFTTDRVFSGTWWKSQFEELAKREEPDEEIALDLFTKLDEAHLAMYGLSQVLTDEEWDSEENTAARMALVECSSLLYNNPKLFAPIRDGYVRSMYDAFDKNLVNTDFNLCLIVGKYKTVLC